MSSPSSETAQELAVPNVIEKTRDILALVRDSLSNVFARKLVLVSSSVKPSRATFGKKLEKLKEILEKSPCNIDDLLSLIKFPYQKFSNPASWIGIDQEAEKELLSAVRTALDSYTATLELDEAGVETARKLVAFLLEIKIMSLEARVAWAGVLTNLWKFLGVVQIKGTKHPESEYLVPVYRSVKAVAEMLGSKNDSKEEERDKNEQAFLTKARAVKL